MLDQMSGGRLDIGFGRGASQIESAMYGNDPAKAELMYVEGLEIIMRGLTHKSLNFRGEFYSFDNVPMELEPLQKPHPPVRVAATTKETFPQVGRMGYPIFIGLRGFDVFEGNQHLQAYRQAWREAGHPGDGG